MASKFTEIQFGCADPQRLAEFWCAVLQYDVIAKDDAGNFVAIGSPLIPEGTKRQGPVPPMVTFARVPDDKAGKNRLHIDVNPTDRDQAEEVQRLLDLGAKRADVGQGEQSWVVLADPEGNEFCVLSTRMP